MKTLEQLKNIPHKGFLWDAHNGIPVDVIQHSDEHKIDLNILNVSRLTSESILKAHGINTITNKYVYRIHDIDYEQIIGVCVFDDRGKIYKIDYSFHN